MNPGTHVRNNRNARPFIAGIVAGLCAAIVISSPAGADDDLAPAKAYIAAFRRLLDRAEREIPKIARLADGAADLFIKNQTLHVAGTERAFLHDLSGRASGLTGVADWSGTQGPADERVLLIPLDSSTDHPDDREEWLNLAARASGAKVVIMASASELGSLRNIDARRPFEPSDFYGFVDNHAPQEEFTYRVPAGEDGTTGRAMLSSVVNVVNGWLFVGELTAACTRRGEMPGFWLSYHVDLPRGYARNKRYAVSGRPRSRQHAFHSDYKVPPVPPETVARSYINHLRSYLHRLERWPDLDEAVRRMAAAARRGRKVYFYSVGHIFPHELARSERDQFPALIESHYFKLEENVLRVCRPGDVLLLLCMPEFEDQVVTAALDKGVQVIAMSSAAPPPALYDNENLYWMAAPWPMTDGCVEIPGYDIPLLAVSGVMHSTIYYALRSQLQVELAQSPPEPAAVGD